MFTSPIQEKVKTALAQAFPDIGFTKTWQGSLKNHWVVYGDQTLYAVEFWQLQERENAWSVHVAYGKLEDGDRFWTSANLASRGDSTKENTWFPPLAWGDGLPESEWVESTPESQKMWASMIKVTLSSIETAF